MDVLKSVASLEPVCLDYELYELHTCFQAIPKQKYCKWFVCMVGLLLFEGH